MPPEQTNRSYLTIVSGLPRSGTSLMMQMVEAGGIPALTDRVREPDEDNPRGYYEFEPVKQLRDDSSWLDAANGKVVKMVYRLLYDLPVDRDYRVVFMRRALDEVLASQEVMLRRLGKPSGEIDGERLAEIYRRELRDVDQWMGERRNFSVLDVEYRDVISDPHGVVAAVNRFLGDDLDTGAMLRVPDQSLYRQRGSTGATPATS